MELSEFSLFSVSLFSPEADPFDFSPEEETDVSLFLVSSFLFSSSSFSYFSNSSSWYSFSTMRTSKSSLTGMLYFSAYS